MDLYFDTPLSPLPSILLLLTTQCIGFGLAGMQRFDSISVVDFFFRDVTKLTGQPTCNVLALNPRYCPALHHPIFYNIINPIIHPATTYSCETSSLSTYLPRHISLSIPPFLILPDTDQCITAMSRQQPIVVDADAG